MKLANTYDIILTASKRRLTILMKFFSPPTRSVIAEFIFKATLVLTGVVQMSPAHSQERLEHEIEIHTDNDLFAWNRTDRYYTYGLFAYFRKDILHNQWRDTFWGKWFRRAEGLSVEIGTGLEAYTPGPYDLEGYAIVYNRPFAGHAYVLVMPTWRYARSLLQLRGQVGLLGPATQAGEIQNWFHRTISNDPELQGWRNQIGNKPAINLVGTWIHPLFHLDWLEIVASPEVSLGNTFTHVLPRI